MGRLANLLPLVAVFLALNAVIVAVGRAATGVRPECYFEWA